MRHHLSDADQIFLGVGIMGKEVWSEGTTSGRLRSAGKSSEMHQSQRVCANLPIIVRVILIDSVLPLVAYIRRGML